MLPNLDSQDGPIRAEAETIINSLSTIQELEQHILNCATALSSLGVPISEKARELVEEVKGFISDARKSQHYHFAIIQSLSRAIMLRMERIDNWRSMASAFIRGGETAITDAMHTFAASRAEVVAWVTELRAVVSAHEEGLRREGRSDITRLLANDVAKITDADLDASEPLHIQPIRQAFNEALAKLPQ
ncbi:hypothetical protein CC2G_013345 [Coprinopsis cinerea AmutBmut pab1-1]|nr:hypothetical protein CC2G_013345 [Coprinopsis cinerea AmutBmut pab1-1]